MDNELRDVLVDENVNAVVNKFSSSTTTDQDTDHRDGHELCRLRWQDGGRQQLMTKTCSSIQLDELQLKLRQANKAGSVSVVAPVWDLTVPPHLYDNLRHSV